MAIWNNENRKDTSGATRSTRYAPSTEKQRERAQTGSTMRKFRNRSNYAQFKDNKVTNRPSRRVHLRPCSLQKARRKMLTFKNEKLSKDSVFENLNKTLNQKFE